MFLFNIDFTRSHNKHHTHSRTENKQTKIHIYKQQQKKNKFKVNTTIYYFHKCFLSWFHHTWSWRIFFQLNVINQQQQQQKNEWIKSKPKRKDSPLLFSYFACYWCDKCFFFCFYTLLLLIIIIIITKNHP